MQNLFDPAANKEITERIAALPAGSPALWGKMTAAQMLLHCSIPIKTALAETDPGPDLKVSILRFLFGRQARKHILVPKPTKKNLPTSKGFLVRNEPDFESAKQNLIKTVERFGAYAGKTLPQPRHVFFGGLTSEEWGVLMWKHLDHHLRQFGG